MTEPAVIDHYLRRLGVEREPPSAEALFRLHRAHVERIPYETTWIQLGSRWDVDPRRSMERIAMQGRGGYCFHLNGAFSELLMDLGYETTRHIGGVHGPEGPVEERMTNHLVLTVAGLPSAANEDGAWYVDVGLGDALHEPLPLRTVSARQGPFDLQLSPAAPGAVGDWELTHDPRGSFAGMSFRAEPAAMHQFAARNEVLSTSPESGFVTTMTVQRRDETGADVLRGLTLKRIATDSDAETKHTIESSEELFDVFADVFGLHIADLNPARKAALWERVSAAHEAWLTSLDQ